jgi:hypothetical protein
MSAPSSKLPEIPPEMLQGDRCEDQAFADTEHLYYRLEEAYPIGSHPLGLSIRNPDFSVNREKHGGRPEFVLIPDWPNFGIAEFTVADLPKPIKSSGGVVYSWKSIHVPSRSQLPALPGTHFQRRKDRKEIERGQRSSLS